MQRRFNIHVTRKEQLPHTSDMNKQDLKSISKKLWNRIHPKTSVCVCGLFGRTNTKSYPGTNVALRSPCLPSCRHAREQENKFKETKGVHHGRYQQPTFPKRTIFDQLFGVDCPDSCNQCTPKFVVTVTILNLSWVSQEIPLHLCKVGRTSGCAISSFLAFQQLSRHFPWPSTHVTVTRLLERRIFQWHRRNAELPDRQN